MALQRDCGWRTCSRSLHRNDLMQRIEPAPSMSQVESYNQSATVTFSWARVFISPSLFRSTVAIDFDGCVRHRWAKAEAKSDDLHQSLVHQTDTTTCQLAPTSAITSSAVVWSIEGGAWQTNRLTADGTALRLRSLRRGTRCRRGVTSVQCTIYRRS